MELELKTYAAKLHKAFVVLAEHALNQGKLPRFYFLKHICDSIADYTLDNKSETAEETVSPQPNKN